MTEEFDVYQTCPCGSGKKLKFCCLSIFGEMQRIAGLQREQQFSLARSALAALERKDHKEVWSRAWVKSVRALNELAGGDKDTARRLVDEVLEEIPGHPSATIALALLTIASEGYPAAKRAVSAAFRAQETRNNLLTSHLARTVAAVLGFEKHYLAAHRHIELALTLGPENDAAIETLEMFERDRSIPYPLREGYHLEPFAGSENLRAQYDEALKLEQMGCFSDAAKVFGGIARQEPDQAWVWWNIALCHAWAAEDPLAVEAFKASAANQADPESAADSLLLARLLHVPTGAARVDHLGREYYVQSVGKLLTRLDQDPLFVRNSKRAEDEDDIPGVVATYQVLDSDPRSLVTDALTLDNLPIVLGQILVLDANPRLGKPPIALVRSIGQDRFDAVTKQFVEIAGAEINPEFANRVTGFTPADIAPLASHWYLPPNLGLAQSDALHRARCEKIIGEIWPATPQESLGGKSPVEAAAIPELNVALRAAVLALDVFCDQSSLPFNPAEVRERLGLPPVTPVELSPEEVDIQLPILKLRRVAFDRVTDGQLVEIIEKVTGRGHAALSEKLLAMVLSRPAVAEKLDFQMVYLSLANLCRDRWSLSEALEWLALGKQDSLSRKLPLDMVALWDMDELLLRSRDPNDPRLAEIAAKLWNYYRPKLPEATKVITSLLNHVQIPGPWNGAAGEGLQSESLAGAGVGTGGLWTPEAEAAGQPSKLWLPGQE